MYRRAMCNQVVTLYHPIPEKKHVVRTVLRGSFCQVGKRSVPDASGDRAGAAMLLVLPDVTQGAAEEAANAAAGQGVTKKMAVESGCGLTARAADLAKSTAQSGAAGTGLRALRYGVDYRAASGDRVVLGEGPAVTWDDWPRFVPAKVDGMGVITYVLPLYLHGELHHVEAGAWWSAGGAGAGRLAR